MFDIGLTLLLTITDVTRNIHSTNEECDYYKSPNLD